MTLLLAAELPSWLAPLLVPSAIIGAVLGIVGKLWANRDRKKQIALACYHAFHICEDIAEQTEGVGKMDKLTEALKQADVWMVANGWRALKPGEKEVAKMTFASLHGEDIVDIKRIVAARPNP